MWQEVLKPHVESGRVVAVGVVQEQHPERAGLYRQWRKLDWPIYVDAPNVLGLAVVPVVVALDESGIVRHRRIRPSNVVSEFLERSYPPMAGPGSLNRAEKPDVGLLLEQADRSPSVESWRSVGDYHFFNGGPRGIARAVTAYEKAVELDAMNGPTRFRLGVALRRRYESEMRRPGDAQAAVEQWGKALAINPNQYIWRRRIQQYGPRLDKPYDFYTWIEEARKDILARGEQPVRLPTEPTGSEVATHLRRPSPDAPPVRSDPDPQGRINRDLKGLMQIESVVTPARVQPGQRVRVQVACRLNEQTRPLWNNEAKDLVLSVRLADGMSFAEGDFSYPNPNRPETRELRVLELEIAIEGNVKPGRLRLPAYALYYVCEKAGGVCRYLRRDFTIVLHVDRNAPKIQ